MSLLSPRAYACLALSMSLVGSYVALSKPLAAAFPVLLLAWLRFGIGGWPCCTGCASRPTSHR
jgi:hypothetical protein